MEKKRKRGRPIKENVLGEQINIRLGTEEREMLNFMCYKTGKTKTDIVRESLKVMYNLVKYQ